VSYVGAGTVEFLVDADAPQEFFFIEMNTRLQVEHPVTEAVTGLDLVALQLAVAAGDALPAAPPVTGHAIEARIYAESPERGFLPSTGPVLRFDAPSDVRVDAAIETGGEVTGFYDPMIAKIIAHGSDRRTALEQLDGALAQTVVLGLDTNVAFLRTLVQNERVIAGDLDTGLIETMLPVLAAEPSSRMVAAARIALHKETAAASPILGEQSNSRGGGVWTALTDTAARDVSFLTDGDEVVDARGVGGGEAGDPAASLPAVIDAEGAVWISEDGMTLRLRPLDRRARMKVRLAAERRADEKTHPEARAPMPGSVVAVHVADGATVAQGDPLVSIEAMKMEHPVLAPHDGTVHLLVAVGDQTRRDQIVATVDEAAEPAHTEGAA
jgi:acetyl-CoA/propionyl-CoA carboxylase biotin carboxyl carrier protein